MTDFLFAGGLSAFAGHYVVFLFSYLSAILGGVISILFTIILCINTNRYFLKRLAVVGIVCAIHQVIIGFSTGSIIVVLIAGVAGVVYQVVKIQDETTTSKERTVLMLSDPLIYWSINWLVLMLLFDV